MPFHPLTDELSLEKQQETLYAVSAPVPACAMWNLPDNKGEEQLPIVTFAEWLRFIPGRSQMDQERLKEEEGQEEELEVQCGGLHRR